MNGYEDTTGTCVVCGAILGESIYWLCVSCMAEGWFVPREHQPQQQEQA